MPGQSAGLLMYRKHQGLAEYFLIHPGGPFWAKKDAGAWSIPKGLAENEGDLLITAQREFREETGLTPIPPYHPLGSVKLKSGKTIQAWAFEGAWDPTEGITSNTIQIQWPPRSNKFISVPEADQAAWLTFEDAVVKIHPAQKPLLERARTWLMQ